MNKWILSLILPFMVFVCVHGQVETFVFKFFNEDHGLSNNLSNEIFQDQSNVLWISSFDGVIRYDGFSIKSFRSNINDTTSLTGNKTNRIYEDDQGRLWVGTYDNGINYSDPNKTRFLHFQPDKHSFYDSLSVTIHDISSDQYGHIWIAGDRGLIILKEIDGQFSQIPLTNYYKHDISRISKFHPKKILRDNLNRIWVGTETGICMIDLSHGAVLRTPEEANFPTENIDDIVQDQNGIVWISRQSFSGRLMYFSEETMSFVPFNEIQFESDRRRIHFAFDRDNRLWASVFGEQLYGYDFRDSTLFLKSNENTNITAERFIRRPFVDHAGNVWVPGQGFFKYDYPRGFKHFTHPFEFSRENTAIYKTDNAFLFAFREAGFIEVDESSGKIKHFSEQSLNDLELKSNHISEFLELRNGKMAILGFGDLSIMDPNSKTLKSIELNGTCRKIIQDKKGNIWAGSFQGLVKLSEHGDILEEYKLPTTAKDGGNYIQAIQEDKKGNIWFGSGSVGLAYLNTKTNEVRHYLPENTEGSLPTGTIIDLLLDDRGDLWIASNVGLIHRDHRTERFTTYNVDDGFVNDYIASLILDNEGILWVSTNDGIASFDLANKTIQNYGGSDGLINKSYYKRSKLYHDGIIYFGGKNGIDFFKPEDIRKNLVGGAPEIFRIRKNDLVDIYLDSTSQAVPLHYKDDLLEIEFGATRFHPADKMEYAYKMEGLLDHWVSLGSQRRVLFSDLRSGEYLFQVKAKARNKEWSPEILTLPILVSTPFWETNWFKFLMAAAVLVCFYLFVKNRENKVIQKEQKEGEIKQTILELEKKALLAQMNPHFIFNSLNAIQHFMTIQDFKGAMKYLSKFGRLLRKVLMISSKNKIAIDQEIQLIENYLELESMRFPNRFTFTIEVDPALDTSDVHIPSFLIQPQVDQAIRNCLATTENMGKINISITEKEDHINVLINDNGKLKNRINGYLYDDKTFNGTLIVEERLKHLNRDLINQKISTKVLKDSSGEQVGTQIELSIDIN